MPVIIVCVLILLLAAAGLGTQVIKKYIPTKDGMELTEYYGASGEGEAIVRSWYRDHGGKSPDVRRSAVSPSGHG